MERHIPVLFLGTVYAVLVTMQLDDRFLLCYACQRFDSEPAEH